MLMKTSWQQANMKAIQNFLLIFLFSFPEQTTAGRDVVCPPWFNDTSSSGSSSSLSTTIRCDSDSLFLLLGNCMTYNSTTDVTKVGSCQYIQHLNTTSLDQFWYIQLPNNVSLLVIKTSPCTRLFQNYAYEHQQIYESYQKVHKLSGTIPCYYPNEKKSCLFFHRNNSTSRKHCGHS